MAVVTSELKRLMHRGKVMCAKPQHRIVRKDFGFQFQAFVFLTWQEIEQGKERLLANFYKE